MLSNYTWYVEYMLQLHLQIGPELPFKKGFIFIYLLKREREKEREQAREREIFLLVCFLNVCNGQGWPGQNRSWRLLGVSWVARSLVGGRVPSTWTIFYYFPTLLLERGIRNGAARSWTSLHIKCQCHWQQFNLLYRSARPCFSFFTNILGALSLSLRRSLLISSNLSWSRLLSSTKESLIEKLLSKSTTIAWAARECCSCCHWVLFVCFWFCLFVLFFGFQ